MKSFLVLVLVVQLGCSQVSVPSYYDAAATRDGLGRAVLPDGSIYEGRYEQGLFHGEGTLTTTRGDQYSGSFQHGLLQGQGRYSASDGRVYEGEFFEGLFHGQGRFLLQDGGVYTGEFLKGQFHGEGLLKFGNGDYYEGSFARGEFNGTGLYVEPSGVRYSGMFKNHEPSGRGLIKYGDGAQYEGEWLDWDASGNGVWTDADGTTYAGQFGDDGPVGEFLIEFTSGEKYQGQMKDWMMSGTGRYIDSEGSVFTGDFEYGALSGNGNIEHKNGGTYTGAVAYWYPHGAGQQTRHNGDQYVGEYKNGRYSGQGKLSRADGSVFEGRFKSGRFHGQGTLTWNSDSGRQVLSGPWRRGLYVGLDRQAYLSDGIAAADVEQLLFDQKPMLDAALEKVEDQRSNEVDLYLLTFAGHGQQTVFRAEAETARAQLQKRFDIKGRSLALVNHSGTTDTEPLASVTNLRYALGALSKKMNTSEDVLFLFLTSHGSKDHALSVNLPGAPMQQLSSQALAQLLDEAGILWRVIVVSACYSGGFIEPLQTDKTLVITSSRADRTSFGCSDDAEMTYFGRAFYEQALPDAPDLISAFNTARKLVTERELAESYEPSEPQIYIGSQMEQKFQRSIPMKP